MNWIPAIQKQSGSRRRPAALAVVLCSYVCELHWLKRTPALNDADKNQDDRHDKQDVNETADRVAAYQAKQPSNDQN
jgi:hypothetical protein